MKSIASIQYVSRKKTAKISVKTLREFKESVVRAIIIVIKTLKQQKSTISCWLLQRTQLAYQW